MDERFRTFCITTKGAEVASSSDVYLTAFDASNQFVSSDSSSGDIRLLSELFVVLEMMEQLIGGPQMGFSETSGIDLGWNHPQSSSEPLQSLF